jgi:hypothetical protein
MKHMILVNSVTYEEWVKLMDEADNNDFKIYVHTEAALPYVKQVKNHYYSIYQPGTVRDVHPDHVPTEEISAQVEGFNLTVRRPIMSNAWSTFKGLFTSR